MSDKKPVGRYSKSYVEDYVKNHTFHDQICGFDHCKRVYELAKKLGKTYDDEVLHAAAFLHDINIGKKDHNLKSAAMAVKIIKNKLPLHKIHEVSEAIINHGMSGRPKSPEAILIHDADLLDYLGAIGFIRLSLMAKEWYARTGIYEILTLIRNLKNKIANSLLLNQSKSKAADLLNVMKLLLQQAEEEL